jgi:hypothetical protein
MSWIVESGIYFRSPIRLYYNDPNSIEITTFLLCNLTDGIVWNPAGKIHLYKNYDVGWTWSSSDPKTMISYINSLWKSNIIPIFYSEIKFDDYYSIIEDIISRLDFDPLIFLSTTPENIGNIITNCWINSSDNSTFNKLDKFPKIIKSYIYTIPKYNVKISKIVGYDLRDLNIDTSMSLKDFKGLIILMGQQGSGKSTLASNYQKLGYKIISSNNASSLRRGIGIEIFITQLNCVTDKIIPGIIIDACNPSRKCREIFITIAKYLQIPYVIGWLTRPGYRWNNDRLLPTPITVLELYANKFEPPNNETCVRLL